jgi:anhydro-N-acetylmuramic acid kinase
VLAAQRLTARGIAELHVELGEFFAWVALSALDALGTRASDVHLVGSHGQTVYHHSGRAGAPRCSLQLGDGDVIAERTGIATVSDFRAKDLAAGGEGAPLVALPDFILLRRPGRVVCALNLGGIANLTVIPERIEDVMAFDTGPGNMVIDALAALLTKGRERYDPGGGLAAKGTVDAGLLGRLLEHPYLLRPPPKSAGRELFGEPFVRRLLASRGRRSLQDLLATMTAFTAETIGRALREHVIPRFPVSEVVVAGGGLRNRTLMARIRRSLRPVPVTGTGTRGVDPRYREAAAFAILAHETLHGHPGNVPGATGARWPVVLGKLSQP